MQAQRISFAFFILFFMLLQTLSCWSATKLEYFLTLKNSDSEIYCDLFYIDGNKGKCRQSRGMTVYPYEAIEKVKVESGGKTFQFVDELNSSKNELSSAFNTLNAEKIGELRAIKEARDAYLAEIRKKKREEAEKRRLEESLAGYDQGGTYSPVAAGINGNDCKTENVTNASVCVTLLDSVFECGPSYPRMFTRQCDVDFDYKLETNYEGGASLNVEVICEAEVAFRNKVSYISQNVYEEDRRKHYLYALDNLRGSMEISFSLSSFEEIHYIKLNSGECKIRRVDLL